MKDDTEDATLVEFMVTVNYAFLMHRMPLWVYMCDAQSDLRETLQQYTI